MFKKILLTLTLLISNTIFCEANREKMDRYLKEIFVNNEDIKESYFLSLSLNQSGKCEEGIKEINKTIELVHMKIKKGSIKNEFISYLYEQRALWNFSLKQYDNVIRDADLALDYNENNGAVYYLKGCAYNQKGNWRLARACVKIVAQKGYRDAIEYVLAYNW